MNSQIRYCSFNDELDFFVPDDWVLVTLAMPDKETKRRAINWLENHGEDRIVIYNGAQRPSKGDLNWASQLTGDGVMYYFFFENTKTATMFKITQGVLAGD